MRRWVPQMLIAVLFAIAATAQQTVAQKDLPYVAVATRERPVMRKHCRESWVGRAIAEDSHTLRCRTGGRRDSYRAAHSSWQYRSASAGSGNST